MFFRFVPRIVIIILALAAAMPTPSRAAGDPAAFIADLGAKAISVLTSTASEAERERQFRVLFEQSFDLPEISRFVLGPYWRTATEQQRQEFVKLFDNYVIHSYTVPLNAYS